ncbi:MFS general substrate transporter [Setomelanomma holmii]|uniref:MFS general substrate transporter n=1 Tax=Setomelanomma holmii TaxID=210430 RepID=A0A9P4LIA0_9PLEO|nr:MFS general substrate transporter [Setomelanomma holmii]
MAHVHTDSTSTDKKDSYSAEQISEVNSATSSEASDEQRTLWQNVKKYRKVTYITFGLTSAILLYGYDNVVVGTISAMPVFQKDFGIFFEGKWILPSTWLALWNIASPIGAMAGSLFGGWLQDKIGRRLALALSSFLSAIGILPPVLRGSGMALFPAFTLLGQLTGALVIYGALNRDHGYAVAFGSQWPFSFVPIVIAFLVPESPAWYVRTRQMDKAYKSQARLDPPGVDTKAIVDKILKDIEHEELSNKATFMECFHKRNFRRTFIIMWSNALTAIFGLQLLAKASYFLQLINMKPGISIIFLILGIVLGLIANVVSIWVLARVGRRPLVVITLLIAALLWASMGIANCTKIVPAVTWWTAASMMLTIVVCGVGVWPASFAIAAETSSLQLRAKSQGIGWFISALSSTASGLALPYVFNPDEGNLRGKTGFTYAASCLIGAAISWYIIPEMKGRNVNEIDRMFEENIPARQFKNWRASDSARAPGAPVQTWV